MKLPKPSLLLAALGIIVLSFFLAYISVFGFSQVRLGLSLENLSMLSAKLKGEESSVNVSIDDQVIKIGFKITGTDQDSVQKISEIFGIDNNWTKGVSMEVDTQSADYLRDLLPIEAAVRLSGNQILIGRRQVNSLVNSDTVKGMLLIDGSNGKIKITIDNPGELLVDATTSGKLKTYTNEPFIVVSKLAKIELELSDHTAIGQIDFK